MLALRAWYPLAMQAVTGHVALVHGRDAFKGRHLLQSGDYILIRLCFSLLPLAYTSKSCTYKLAGCLLPKLSLIVPFDGCKLAESC